MGQGRRQFTDEFKREAVALLASSGRPLLQIASELGISPSMLRNWRNRSEGRNAGPAPGIWSRSPAANCCICSASPVRRRFRCGVASPRFAAADRAAHAARFRRRNAQRQCHRDPRPRRRVRTGRSARSGSWPRRRRSASASVRWSAGCCSLSAPVSRRSQRIAGAARLILTREAVLA